MSFLASLFKWRGQSRSVSRTPPTRHTQLPLDPATLAANTNRVELVFAHHGFIDAPTDDTLRDTSSSSMSVTSDDNQPRLTRPSLIRIRMRR